ncbi:Unknown protein [Striga hermonthica]|uniref:Uncharacterized protein n=1 Tax=Striga hermonthica TaxID=68872 RepID=A0A9N7NEJ1_STRHE|nr:Unknown protein [Striga hermonthica]
MGSNYFGDHHHHHQHHHNHRNYYGEGGVGLTSSSSSSSRKGKKNGSDKPKQPQRGLGVAQLEKIRLHSQLGCAYLPSLHNNNPYAPSNYIQQEDMRLQTPHSSSPPSYSGFQGHMMGLPEIDRSNIPYGDSQPSNIARWHQGNGGFRTQQYFVEPSMTRSFFDPKIQGNKNKREFMDWMGSGDGNSVECSSSQDIDLELRLSL